MYNNVEHKGGRAYPKRSNDSFAVKQQQIALFIQQKKYNEAEKHNNAILQQDPHDYLSQALKAVIVGLYYNDKNQSLQIFEALLAKRDDWVEVNKQYIRVLMHFVEFTKAKDVIRKLINAYPHVGSYYIHAGQIYSRMQEYQATVDVLHEALQYEPNNLTVLGNLALAYRDCMNFEKSEYYYRKGLAKDPYNGLLNANYTMLLSLKGEYDRAWQQYYARWYAPTMEKNIPAFACDIEYWRPLNANEGQNPPPLIIWQEQGLGDHIVFCSMLDKLLSITNNKIIIHINPKLGGIFARTYPQIEFVIFVPPSAWLKERGITHHMPMADLMALYKHDDIFPKTKWLKVNKELSTHIRDALQKALPNKELIAISWDTLGPNSYRRRVPVEKMLSLLHKRNMAAISLQYDADAKELAVIKQQKGYVIVQTSIDLWHDIDGVAALIDACDGMISIANVNGHIAGAIGKKAIMLITYSSDWRWGFANKSPFYESLHLLRQETLGDGWDTVLQKAEDLLDKGFFTQK